MSFRFANVSGRSALVDGDGRWYDAERLSDGAVAADPMIALAHGPALHAANERVAGAEPDGELAAAELGAPVPRPRNVFGVGLNYRAHAEESGVDLPERPVVFTKFPSCIVGPNTDVVLACDAADWEVELVVAIGGQQVRDVEPADAWTHVLGVTIGQDISDRALQFAAKPPHFDLGKSRDTYGPIGPVLVSPDLLGDRDDLALSCAINGDVRQDARTSGLIFTVSDLVSYLSKIMTLTAGDLIFTGTPAGVGVAKGTFLRPGDEITSTIEGIGTMVNRCV